MNDRIDELRKKAMDYWDGTDPMGDPPISLDMWALAEIIRLRELAGINTPADVTAYQAIGYNQTLAAVANAIAREREECAKALDAMRPTTEEQAYNSYEQGRDSALEDGAAAIRARKEG